MTTVNNIETVQIQFYEEFSIPYWCLMDSYVMVGTRAKGTWWENYKANIWTQDGWESGVQKASLWEPNTLHHPPTIVSAIPDPGSRCLRYVCFKLIRTPKVEDFSTSIWDWSQPSIARNLGSFWFIAVIPVLKINTAGRFDMLTTFHL